MTRIGAKQLGLLVALGHVGRALVVPDKLSGSLERRGLIKPRFPTSDGFLCITPAGLRALADAMESGVLEPFMIKKPESIPESMTLAQGIAARSGETALAGSTEGKSPASEAGAP